MSTFSNWSAGAKLLTISVVGFLLTFGLCSVGTQWEQPGTPAQNFAAGAGLITFLVSVLLFVVGLIALIVRAIRKERRGA